MEAPPKVHRHHRHRRTSSRRRYEENIANERRSSSDQHLTNNTDGAVLGASATAPIPSLSSINNSQNTEQPSLLVNGYELHDDDEQRPQQRNSQHNSRENTNRSGSIAAGSAADSNQVAAVTAVPIATGVAAEDGGVGGGNVLRNASAVTPTTLTTASVTTKHDDRNLYKGILGFLDREFKATTTPKYLGGNSQKLQSFSDPQASPAQRSTRSRSSLDKSPRRKRSKSESRRRRERKLIAAGEMEVRQANETLMRYLKQCSEMNDASLSGELEIDHSFDERRVHRKTKSQRDRRGHLLTRTSGSGLSSILKDLSEDIVPNNGEIYNPFTPVVSPTEGPPSRINKMFIQTSTGYRAVDHCFYKNPIGSDPESNRNDIVTSVNLSCALQRIWIMVSNICHGLLGGLALAHLLFIATSRPYEWADGVIRHYSSFAEIYANTFYFLAIICMVSVFDRMDICHVDITSAPEIISFRWIIITMLYIATIILTLCAESIDEKLYLKNFNITILESEMENNQVLGVWNSLSIARNIGALIGWIMIGLSSSEDMLYSHLIEMEKYQLTNN